MRYKKMGTRKGFTLIEVMTVVAVIGILASVAMPSYLESVRRSNRAEAAATMLEAANWLQRAYTVSNTYVLAATETAQNAALKTAGFGQSPKSGAAKYTLTLTAAATTATDFELVATPAGTADKCGTFKLDATGKRTVTGSAAAADCWGGR